MDEVEENKEKNKENIKQATKEENTNIFENNKDRLANQDEGAFEEKIDESKENTPNEKIEDATNKIINDELSNIANEVKNIKAEKINNKTIKEKKSLLKKIVNYLKSTQEYFAMPNYLNQRPMTKEQIESTIEMINSVKSKNDFEKNKDQENIDSKSQSRHEKIIKLQELKREISNNEIDEQKSIKSK